MKFKNLRWCVQCRTLLPLKCKACVCNSKRRPKQVEVYDMPDILETRDCGCVKIACQLQGCNKTTWKHVAYKRQGNKFVYKAVYCSRECVHKANTIRQTKGQLMECANKCGAKIWRSPALVKYYAWSVCSPACREMYRFKLKKEEANKAKEDSKRAMLCCYSHKCRGAMTEHIEVLDKFGNKVNQYKCIECAAQRKAPAFADSVRDKAYAKA